MPSSDEPRDVTRAAQEATPYTGNAWAGLPVWPEEQIQVAQMCMGGDMGPNMGTTINKIACATNGRKLNRAFHILFMYAYRSYKL
ncbi:hypothetical protein E2C01_067805 [Portunus trituberculatus]|uniref:Uncharacterized protein n=1 Tax=Portunus trituberculatus TaxID=210409 RepID=A0A5B7HUL9_PORTR|nr:hypothetical protein [Portunus trituberculatus]